MSFETDFLQAIQDKKYQNIVNDIAYAKFIGMRCESYGESMMFTLPANENNLGNPMIPAIHGGVLAGFMETAAMIQLMVLLQTPTIPKIVNISFDYLRAGFHRDTFSECSITRQGRRVANVNVRAWQKKRDEPLATARAHFLLS